MEIAIEMSLDLEVIVRNSFTIMDLLSDIGGIEIIFCTAFSFLVSILNHGYFDTFMASRLFKIQKQDDDKNSARSNFQRSNFFKPTFCGNIRQYFIDCLPSKTVCCKKTRMVRSILKAR